jgi:hypothetical protein
LERAISGIMPAMTEQKDILPKRIGAAGSLSFGRISFCSVKYRP